MPRAVQVLVFDEQGRLGLQRRHHSKDTAPGAWDLSCSEHLQPKEGYGAAALRGLREELGIDTAAANLQRLLPAFLQENSYPELKVVDREFVEVWKLPHPTGQVNIDQVEVVDFRWLRLDTLAAWLAKTPEDFAPWVLDTFSRLGFFEGVDVA